MRAGELIGRTAYDRSGRHLGRVVDLVVEGDLAPGRLRLTGLVVTVRWYGRLLGALVGPGTAPHVGPWPVRAVGRWLDQCGRVVPADQVRLDPPLPDWPTPRGVPTDG